MNRRRVVIIGGGPGGYVAGIRAAQLGAKVFLIEKDKIGGTCLNRGCIPTKALISDAGLLRSLKHSPVFRSLRFEGFSPLERMMDRKRKVVEEIVKGVELLLESHHVTVKYARANLLGTNQVILQDGKGSKEVIESETIILALGSKTKTHPSIPVDGEKIISSDEALEIKEVPQEMVIIGGGYIGVEFATLFSILGSKVTIVEILEDILFGVEGELVRNLRRSMERDGIKILTRSTVEDIRHIEERIGVTVRTPQGVQEIHAEKVLLSVGRTPNLDLDFSKAGVGITPDGIQVNRSMQTNIPHIYAIGDAVGGILLAHVAMEEGVVAAENAMGMNRQMEDQPVPMCVFTHPEIATIGLTEKKARESGEIKVGRFPFRSNPRTLISGETEGLIKVIGSKETDEILGVHILGSEASSMIPIVSPLLTRGGKAREFSQIIQAHPTTSEALREAFLDMEGLAIHLPRSLRDSKR